MSLHRKNNCQVRVAKPSVFSNKGCSPKFQSMFDPEPPECAPTDRLLIFNYGT
jgi:hypothetical protein